MWQDLVGRRSRPVTNWVERGAVRAFARAIGDPNPLYVDEEAARVSRYGRLIAPPTFPITLDYGEIEGLTLPSAGLIHGSQSFDYNRPLYVGETLSCYTVFDKTFDKKGALGLMTFMVFNRVGEDEAGDVVFTTSGTLIVTEAAKRGVEG